MNNFNDIPLAKELLKNIEKIGYTEPTAVQSNAILPILHGHDLIVTAPTGTGKTASFVLPILERLTAVAPRGHGPRALVLVPTRELAVQVKDEFEKLAYGSKLRCVAVYGGKPIKGQIDRLAKRPQVIVGTPGRVLDHLSRGTIALSDLEITEISCCRFSTLRGPCINCK